MQNKANFRKSQVNVNPYNTTDYENKSDWTPGENKPNSKPNKANLKRAKMNVNSLTTKDYRKNDDFAVQKNKPNSNPISIKPKMNVNAFSQKDYENKTALGLRKNKPKQSQFQTGHLQRPSQCYRPAGGNNDKHGQNYVSYFDLGEKTLQKPEIDTKNSYKQSQNCCRNQYAAQQTGSRLDIKCFEDSALSESENRGGHSAGWTRQVVFLLETAVAEPPAHIGFIMSYRPEQPEESNHHQANNRRYKSLARRCTAENF